MGQRTVSECEKGNVRCSKRLAPKDKLIGSTKYFGILNKPHEIIPTYKIHLA